MNLLHANDKPGQYPPSYYAATSTFPDLRDALMGEVPADVSNIGGGFTGLSTALHLAQAGRSVVVLEAQRVGFGASGRNGGQMGSGQRLDQVTLERRVGKGDARIMWNIAQEAKALVRSLIDEHKIDVGLKPGVAHAVWSEAEVREEAEAVEHLARHYGYDQIRMLDRPAIAALTGSRGFTGGSLDMGAGHLHPLRLALGLAAAAEAAGVRIYERSEVHHIAPGASHTVQTGQGRVVAPTVVLAANGYLGRLDRRVAARVLPINNYIIATEPLDAQWPEVLAQDVAVADSRFVVNYWRRSEDGRLLFGGGETYGHRFPADIAAVVRSPMLTIYPQLANARIDYAWGGTLAITPKRFPLFDRPRAGVWSASGYCGHGLALAVMAGKILSAAIGGETGQFDVMARFKVPPFPGGAAFGEPIMSLAMRWFALRDKLGI